MCEESRKCKVEMGKGKGKEKGREVPRERYLNLKTAIGFLYPCTGFVERNSDDSERDSEFEYLYLLCWSPNLTEVRYVGDIRDTM